MRLFLELVAISKPSGVRPPVEILAAWYLTEVMLLLQE